jgi:hypothetical protein
MFEGDWVELSDIGVGEARAEVIWLDMSSTRLDPLRLLVRSALGYNKVVIKPRAVPQPRFTFNALRAHFRPHTSSLLLLLSFAEQNNSSEE